MFTKSSRKNRVTGDLFEITELAHHGPEDLFISSVTILGAFCIMLTIQWQLALIVFAVIPLFVLFTALSRKKMMQASTEVKAKLAGINGEVESSISGMRTAKAFANEEAESAKFNAANDQFRGAKRGYYRTMAFYQSGMEFFMGILSVLVIAFGGFLIMRDGMDFIDLTTFVREQEGAREQQHDAHDHEERALDASGGDGEYPPVEDHRAALGVEQVQYARKNDDENQRFEALEYALELDGGYLHAQRGDQEHDGVAYPVHGQEQRHDEDDDQYELRARVQLVYYGVAGEVLAEGDVLEHQSAAPFLSGTSAARSWSSV